MQDRSLLGETSEGHSRRTNCWIGIGLRKLWVGRNTVEVAHAQEGGSLAPVPFLCQKLWKRTKVGRLSVWRGGSLGSHWQGPCWGQEVTGLSRKDPDFRSLALITRLSFLAHKSTLSCLSQLLWYSRFQRRFFFLNRGAWVFLRASMEEFKRFYKAQELYTKCCRHVHCP